MCTLNKTAMQRALLSADNCRRLRAHDLYQCEKDCRIYPDTRHHSTLTVDNFPDLKPSVASLKCQAFLKHPDSTVNPWPQCPYEATQDRDGARRLRVYELPRINNEHKIYTHCEKCGVLAHNVCVITVLVVQ